MKEPPARAAGGSLECYRVSDDPNVLSLFTLATGGHVELDALTLFKRLVSRALDVGVVHEDVFTLLTRDEAEALLGVEELHGTCCQLLLFSACEQVLVTVSTRTSVGPRGRACSSRAKSPRDRRLDGVASVECEGPMTPDG